MWIIEMFKFVNNVMLEKKKILKWVMLKFVRVMILIELVVVIRLLEVMLDCVG